MRRAPCRLGGVERQNPAHAQTPASAAAGARHRVDSDGVDREEPTRSPAGRRQAVMLSAGLNAFVMPTSQRSPAARQQRACGSAERRCPLQARSPPRRSAARASASASAHVVHQPGNERRDPRVDRDLPTPGPRRSRRRPRSRRLARRRSRRLRRAGSGRRASARSRGRRRVASAAPSRGGA